MFLVWTDFLPSGNLSLGALSFIEILFWLGFDNWDGDCLIELLGLDSIAPKSSSFKFRPTLLSASDTILEFILGSLGFVDRYGDGARSI